MNKFQQIYTDARQVLVEQKYVFILFSFALFFFALFVFIPVATIPGNTFTYQLSIFRAQDYLLMVFLALLVGLNFSMNIYAWKQRQSVNISKSAASGTMAGFGGAFAAIVGTATCASPRFFIWHCRTWNRQCCVCFEVPDIIPSWSHSACGYLSLLYRAKNKQSVQFVLKYNK